jgi:hypothetical protein
MTYSHCARGTPGIGTTIILNEAGMDLEVGKSLFTRVSSLPPQNPYPYLSTWLGDELSRFLSPFRANVVGEGKGTTGLAATGEGWKLSAPIIF